MPAPVPDSAWERLYVAAGYGLTQPILSRLSANTLALFTKTNLIVLALMLGAWAGGTIVGGPVAWVVDLGLGAIGLYYLGKQIVEFSADMGQYALIAYPAKTEAELQKAGEHFAQALVTLGDTAIQTAFSWAAFRGTRALVERLGVGKKLPDPPRQQDQAPRQQERPPQERAPEERLPEERLPEERLPEERLPEERLPEERLPEERLPEERLPEERLPEERVRAEERFQEETPAQTRARKLREFVTDAARGRGALELSQGDGMLWVIGGVAAAGLLIALLLVARGGGRR